jgi:hypothetical protein
MTGVVVAVDGPNLAEVDRIALRTEDVELWQLTVGRLDLSDGGLPAAHLREHLLNGEPITVYFCGSALIRYTDAAP